MSLASLMAVGPSRLLQAYFFDPEHSLITTQALGHHLVCVLLVLNESVLLENIIFVKLGNSGVHL